MPLLQLIIMLALVGFVVWLVLTYIPMPDLFKKLIVVIIVIAVILYVANMFGVFSSPALTVPMHR